MVAKRHQIKIFGKKKSFGEKILGGIRKLDFYGK